MAALKILKRPTLACLAVLCTLGLSRQGGPQDASDGTDVESEQYVYKLGFLDGKLFKGMRNLYNAGRTVFDRTSPEKEIYPFSEFEILDARITTQEKLESRINIDFLDVLKKAAELQRRLTENLPIDYKNYDSFIEMVRDSNAALLRQRVSLSSKFVLTRQGLKLLRGRENGVVRSMKDGAHKLANSAKKPVMWVKKRFGKEPLTQSEIDALNANRIVSPIKAQRKKKPHERNVPNVERVQVYCKFHQNMIVRDLMKLDRYARRKVFVNKRAARKIKRYEAFVKESSDQLGDLFSALADMLNIPASKPYDALDISFMSERKAGQEMSSKNPKKILGKLLKGKKTKDSKRAEQRSKDGDDKEQSADAESVKPKKKGRFLRILRGGKDSKVHKEEDDISTNPFGEDDDSDDSSEFLPSNPFWKGYHGSVESAQQAVPVYTFGSDDEAEAPPAVEPQLEKLRFRKIFSRKKNS